MTNVVRRNDYIFAQGEDRELTTIIRLICDPSGQARDQFGVELNLSMPYVWLGLRIPQKRLLRGYASKKFMGDVDVCGGSLEPTSREHYNECVAVVQDEIRRHDADLPEDYPAKLRSAPHPLFIHNLASMKLLERRSIKWPPDFSNISAVEVKAAWYTAESDLKATGSKYVGRNQAHVLCDMGFDRVALAKYVITEPVNSIANAWSVASSRSSDAGHEYLNDKTKGILVEDKDPFGTLLVQVGAVPGKLEHMAGSASWRWLRSVPSNPILENVLDKRLSMEATLREVMGRYPPPARVPVFVLACSRERCGNLYCSDTHPSEPCSKCGSLPRSAPQQDGVYR